jgi:hypothetical protein
MSSNPHSPRPARCMSVVERLRSKDRVLLVPDRRQHEAVESGRPFAQLQDAGTKTVKLEEIVRQKNPELKRVVEQLARGNVPDAIHDLDLLSVFDCFRHQRTHILTCEDRGQQ